MMAVHDETRSAARGAADRITLASVLLSVGLLALLFAAYLAHDSRLALAQAADSFSDVFTASALLWALRVSVQPPDENHPFGHQSAQPIAALVAAVLAGVLAVEVVRSAVAAIVAGAEPSMAWPLAGAFALKIVAKATVSALAGRQHRRVASPALRALQVDARNDVLVGLLAVLGFFGARYGYPGLDAWLALPIGLYIGASGVGLGVENIRLLMGEAPPPERRAALLAAAREISGVREARGLKARYQGSELSVVVDVLVNPELSVREAHDIGEAVEARLREEPDVCQAMVHVDTD